MARIYPFYHQPENYPNMKNAGFESSRATRWKTQFRSCPCATCPTWTTARCWKSTRPWIYIPVASIWGWLGWRSLSG